MTNYAKTCSFLHAHFTETIKVVDILFKKAYGEKLIYLKDMYHWPSSHYAVTHVRNKNSNIQGRSPNVVKVIFHTIRNYS